MGHRPSGLQCTAHNDGGDSRANGLNRAERAHLAVDGKMDTATHAALKRFQKTQGLQMTGRVNKATWRALGL